MKHTISHQRQTLELLEDLLDYFYSVSITKWEIRLQAEYSQKLIKKLELLGANFTEPTDDFGYYKATISINDTNVTIHIEAEEN